MKGDTGRVLVTGGGTGIGRAIAERLRDEGHEVIAVGRRPIELEGIETLQWDVTKPGLIDEVGPVDHLVNNAGKGHIAAVEDWSDEDLRSLLEVHCVAPARLARRWASSSPTGGCVVNIASTLALRSARGLGLYAAAKAGLVSLTRSLAIELAPDRRANALLVGVVKTPMTEDRDLSALEALHPLGLGEPTDVAEAVSWLLSARWVTGAAIPVDGGQLL